jgi:secreted trypsin-like serine protease
MKQTATQRHILFTVLLLALFLITTVQPAQAIVGGQDAKLGEFPFLVALVSPDDGSQFCGGSIIDKEWILTAAHCFYSDDDTPVQNTFAKDVQIKAGIIDLNDTTAQVADVTKIYDPGYDGNIHDIALLHLAKPLKLNNKTVAAINLNTDPDFPKKDATLMVAGWGALDPKGEKYVDTLKKVTLPLTTCEPDTASDYVCAGGKGGKDTCQGDSGGPLVVQQAADSAATIDPTALVPGINALQIGIVSYGGDRCGQRGAYTRVAVYNDWITKIMSESSNP